MFEKFTARAQQIIKIFAQEEAKRLNHDLIQVEHVFLGLLREGEGLAARILINLGLDLDLLQEETENMLPKGKNVLLIGDIPVSENAKKVLKLAQDESKNLGHTYVGTEHLLLGIMSHNTNYVVELLLGEGVDIELIKEEIHNILGEGWVAEEALANALYCVMRSPDNFSEVVLAAANNSGDSDSVGAIAGAIIGARLGLKAIPKDWQNRIEDKAKLLYLASILSKLHEDKV